MFHSSRFSDFFHIFSDLFESFGVLLIRGSVELLGVIKKEPSRVRKIVTQNVLNAAALANLCTDHRKSGLPMNHEKNTNLHC